MRFPYTITNIVIKEDGTIDVEVHYTLYNTEFDVVVSIFPVLSDELKSNPEALSRYILSEVDTSIQNRIGANKAAIERLNIGNVLKNKFSSLVGSEIDLTAEELKAKIEELSKQA